MYQKFRQVAPTSLFITYTLHPLPDRDRSRIANAGLVRPHIQSMFYHGLCVKLFVSEPPVIVISLLIVRVGLSSDAGTFGGDGWIRTTVLLRTDLQSAAIDLSATSPIWNNGRDLNPRLLGFAIPCIGPLCHRCIVLVLGTGFEPV